MFPKRIDEYEALLTKNPLLLDRLLGIGYLTKETALSYGVTGPILRASGVDWDLRKAAPIYRVTSNMISMCPSAPKVTTTPVTSSACRRCANR